MTLQQNCGLCSTATHARTRLEHSPLAPMGTILSSRASVGLTDWSNHRLCKLRRPKRQLYLRYPCGYNLSNQACLVWHCACLPVLFGGQLWWWWCCCSFHWLHSEYLSSGAEFIKDCSWWFIRMLAIRTVLGVPLATASLCNIENRAYYRQHWLLLIRIGVYTFRLGIHCSIPTCHPLWYRWRRVVVNVANSWLIVDVYSHRPSFSETAHSIAIELTHPRSGSAFARLLRLPCFDCVLISKDLHLCHLTPFCVRFLIHLFSQKWSLLKHPAVLCWKYWKRKWEPWRTMWRQLRNCSRTKLKIGKKRFDDVKK